MCDDEVAALVVDNGAFMDILTNYTQKTLKKIYIKNFWIKFQK